VLTGKIVLSLFSPFQLVDVVDDGTCLDLCQFVGLLLIPQLLDASQKTGDLGENMFGPFIQDISALGLGGGNKEVSTRSCRNVLRRIWESHDEFGASDELLDEMIAVARDGSLSQALMGDLSSFDLEWKNKETTSFQDVMQVKSVSEPSSDAEDAPRTKKAGATLVPLKRKFTAAFIDYMADTYRRPCFVMLIWGCGVISYVAYVFLSVDNSWGSISCGSLSDTGCGILSRVVGWLVVMVQLSTLGLIFVTLGSFGNNVFLENKKKWSIISSLVAMAAISITTVVPFFVVRTCCL